MSNLPLVTVGAANYNNAKYVLKTLESIKYQSYPNIELIIVDDCSTDNSVELIENWLTSYDKPFKFIKHDINLGVCAACNGLLKNASGKYISTIATDDILMEEKIMNQVKILENSDNDVCAVYSDAYLIKEDGSPRYGWFIQNHGHFVDLPSGNIFNRLLEGNYLPAMSLLVKKSSYDEIGMFDENLVYEDYDMWLRLSKKYKFILSDYVSVKYRIRDSSASFTIKNWNNSYIQIFLKHLDNPVALKQLEKIVIDMYLTKEKVDWHLLKPHIYTSKKLRLIYLLSKMYIPSSIGIRTLNSSIIFRNSFAAIFRSPKKNIIFE